MPAEATSCLLLLLPGFPPYRPPSPVRFGLGAVLSTPQTQAFFPPHLTRKRYTGQDRQSGIRNVRSVYSDGRASPLQTVTVRPPPPVFYRLR